MSKQAVWLFKVCIPLSTWHPPPAAVQSPALAWALAEWRSRVPRRGQNRAIDRVHVDSRADTLSIEAPREACFSSLKLESIARTLAVDGKAGTDQSVARSPTPSCVAG